MSDSTSGVLLPGEGTIEQVAINANGVFVRIMGRDLMVYDPFRFYTNLSPRVTTSGPRGDLYVTLTALSSLHTYRLIVDFSSFYRHGEFYREGEDLDQPGRWYYDFTEEDALVIFRVSLPEFGRLVVKDSDRDAFMADVELFQSPGETMFLRTHRKHGKTAQEVVREYYGDALADSAIYT